MSHDHGHGHGHGHHHHHGTSGRLGMAFALNVGFTLLELVGAWFTNSTAIAADAVHDLGDSVALGFAWFMERMAGRKADTTYTYGLKRLSLLGALVNVVVLVGGGVLVLVETVPRLFDPPSPNAGGMVGLAILGILVNGAAVLKVRGGSSMNEQIVTWHLLEDVLGWVAVLIVATTLLFVDLPILDPLLSVALTSWITWNAVKGLRKTLDLFLQGVPDDVALDALQKEAEQVRGVRALQHLHVWSLEGDHHVLTGQLLVEPCDLREALAIRDLVRERLEERGIVHVTLEVALDAHGPGAQC